jgi:Protein of unknown function (DUF3261)
MMRCYRNLILMMLLALLSACASAPSAPDCTRIGHEGQFCALAPAQLPAIHANHIVTISHDGQQDTFMGDLQIDQHALRLAGLSLFGTSLFTISYDGHSMTQHPANKALHADLLVTMLELTLANPAMLRPQLHNLTLRVSDNGKAQVRELFEHGHLIARVETVGTPLTRARIDISIPLAKLAIQMTPLTGDGFSP